MPRVPAPRRPQAATRRPPDPYPARAPRPAPPRHGQARTTAPARRGGQPVHRPEDRPAEPRNTPQVQLIPAPLDGAVDAAEEAVDLLLESGRAPGDILVLTTGEPHPWAAHELSFGESSYWAQHDARDDVFFADASVVDRASTRPVVVVAVNGGDDTVTARALPAAMNRAGALLVVCGDPERINTVLGTAL